MSQCHAKHTKPQIPDKDWHCLQCGAGIDDKGPFEIEESDERAADDCPLLHEQDSVVCRSCGIFRTGKQIAAAYAKKKNLVPCPGCKGTGYVKKGEKG